MSGMNSSYLWLTLGLAAAVGVGYVLHVFFFGVLKRIATSTPISIDTHLVKHLRDPARLIFILLAVRSVLPILGPMFPEGFFDPLHLGLYFFSLLIIAWIVVKFISVLEDTLVNRYRMDKKDNLYARKIHTQFMVFKRLGILLTSIVVVSVALLRFESVRTIGTGLLASVGVMGIVIGLAAQRTVGTLLAGIQIAFAQPIRLDDVVIVEGEWGRIEEINFTYVVIRIWDARRLIVPTTYFLEHPFQNWTKTSSDMLGTVFLYVDYRFPVEALRRELLVILQQSRWWDGKAWALQVTDCRETTMELRALMSAEDSPAAWELRCEVRERLIGWIQHNHPDSLPRLRIAATSLTESRLGEDNPSGHRAGFVP